MIKAKIEKYKIFVIIILALTIPGYSFLSATRSGDAWSLASDGTFLYPENRGSVQYEEIVLNGTPNFTLSKIVYESKGEKIYALLRMPKNTGRQKVPALVVLPGALVTKEDQQWIGEFLREQGFATLTLDERGNGGETGGGIKSMDEEYLAYTSGKEPVSHKMVFDALRAFDILREREGIDESNIGIYGESMGGRYAIIAAALEPRIKFLAGVSTSGYGSGRQFFNDANVARFYASIDPDSYIGRISPRKVIMVHALQDKTVPIESAKSTFNYANEPKIFIEVNSTCHGLCAEMKPLLVRELKIYG